MFCSTQWHSFGYLPCHFAHHAARSRRTSASSRRSPGSGFAGPRTGSKPPHFQQAIVVDPARHVIQRVAQNMHVAALPDRLRKHLADRRLEPRMVIGDDEFDAEQTALLQAKPEVAPARPALPVGQLHRQHLPPPLGIHRHRDQHRLAHDHAALAHPFVARVQDQIRIRLAQPPLGNGA
jgi:hypothetical protein